MIVVKLMDGLGNQMFQYAFGRFLQEVYHEKVVFETMKLQHNSTRKLGIQNFNIPLSNKGNSKDSTCRFASPIENIILQAISKSFRLIAEKIFRISMSGEASYHAMIKWGFYTTNDSISYYTFRKTKKKVKFVRGYFQSEKYFAEISEIIKKELRIKNIDNTIVHRLARQMEKENSVCIHIRRDDYIGNKRFEICTEKYYRQAVELIKEKVKKPIFYVFSNSSSDLKWIKEHYNFTANMHFVEEGKNEFEDLFLMYHCQNHIISNSTFSWWGSYLSNNSITIAPQKWINSDEKQDVLRDEWILI